MWNIVLKGVSGVLKGVSGVSQSLLSRPAAHKQAYHLYKSLHLSSAMDEFRIRLITTEMEFENIVTKAMAKKQWRPGLKDAESILACDPTGSFVGELNGKPVGCLALIKYGDSFAFVGCFIVSEEYRGKGYGTKIYNAAMTSVKPSWNIALLAGPDHQKMYERRGFRGHFNVTRFDFHLPTDLKCLTEISENSAVNIKCIDQVDEKALLAYDSVVFGFPRHAFLSKWLRASGSHARVAINEEGSVIGYVVARVTFKEDGYRMGPLFADFEPIAEKLLKSVFEELLQQDDSAPVVSIDAPQQNTMRLAEKLQGKSTFRLMYMATKGLPGACFDKWFGCTGFEIV